MGRIERDIPESKTDVRYLDDLLLQRDVRERLPSYLGRFALRLRPVSDVELAELLETAADEGRISEEQVEDAKLIDAVARGRRRADGATIYLAAEISTVINPYDLERAIRRAKIIAEATNTVTLPVVVGETIREDVRRLTEAEGAGYVLFPQE